MKYKSKKTVVDGIAFDSKLESEYYRLLKKKKEKGEILDFTLQPEFLLQESFRKNGKHFREIKYIADFQVIHLDRSIQIIDIKGVETADFKLKKKLFEYRYPNLTLTVLKYVKKYGGWITTEEYNRKKRLEKKKRKK